MEEFQIRMSRLQETYEAVSRKRQEIENIMKGKYEYKNKYHEIKTRELDEEIRRIEIYQLKSNQRNATIKEEMEHIKQNTQRLTQQENTGPTLAEEKHKFMNYLNITYPKWREQIVSSKNQQARQLRLLKNKLSREREKEDMAHQLEDRMEIKVQDAKHDLYETSYHLDKQQQRSSSPKEEYKQRRYGESGTTNISPFRREEQLRHNFLVEHSEQAYLRGSPRETSTVQKATYEHSRVQPPFMTAEGVEDMYYYEREAGTFGRANRETPVLGNTDMQRISGNVYLEESSARSSPPHKKEEYMEDPPKINKESRRASGEELIMVEDRSNDANKYKVIEEKESIPGPIRPPHKKDARVKETHDHHDDHDDHDEIKEEEKMNKNIKSKKVDTRPKNSPKLDFKWDQDEDEEGEDEGEEKVVVPDTRHVHHVEEIEPAHHVHHVENVKDIQSENTPEEHPQEIDPSNYVDESYDQGDDDEEEDEEEEQEDSQYESTLYLSSLSHALNQKHFDLLKPLVNFIEANLDSYSGADYLYKEDKEKIEGYDSWKSELLGAILDKPRVPKSTDPALVASVVIDILESIKEEKENTKVSQAIFNLNELDMAKLCEYIGPNTYPLFVKIKEHMDKCIMEGKTTPNIAAKLLSQALLVDERSPNKFKENKLRELLYEMLSRKFSSKGFMPEESKDAASSWNKVQTEQFTSAVIKQKASPAKPLPVHKEQKVIMAEFDEDEFCD